MLYKYMYLAWSLRQGSWSSTTEWSVGLGAQR